MPNLLLWAFFNLTFSRQGADTFWKLESFSLLYVQIEYKFILISQAAAAGRVSMADIRSVYAADSFTSLAQWRLPRIFYCGAGCTRVYVRMVMCVCVCRQRERL